MCSDAARSRGAPPRLRLIALHVSNATPDTSTSRGLPAARAPFASRGPRLPDGSPAQPGEGGSAYPWSYRVNPRARGHGLATATLRLDFTASQITRSAPLPNCDAVRTFS
jgi:hypothetical protein